MRACAATAIGGLLLIEFCALWPVALAGAVLMGLGTSLGLPVGVSSAADDPQYAAGRVSTAASIGYAAFLAGPPLIGFLADYVGVLHGMSIAGVLLAVAFLLCGATAPISPSSQLAPEGECAGRPAQPGAGPGERCPGRREGHTWVDEPTAEWPGRDTRL